MEINNTELGILMATCDQVASEISRTQLADLQLTYVDVVGLGDVILG